MTLVRPSHSRPTLVRDDSDSRPATLVPTVVPPVGGRGTSVGGSRASEGHLSSLQFGTRVEQAQKLTGGATVALASTQPSTSCARGLETSSRKPSIQVLSSSSPYEEATPRVHSSVWSRHRVREQGPNKPLHALAIVFSPQRGDTRVFRTTRLRPRAHGTRRGAPDSPTWPGSSSLAMVVQEICARDRLRKYLFPRGRHETAGDDWPGVSPARGGGANASQEPMAPRAIPRAATRPMRHQVWRIAKRRGG